MAGLRSEIALALLASLLIVMVSGAAVSLDDEINLPGIFLPNMDDVLNSGDNPKPCCLPNKWQGSVTSQVGWGVKGKGGEDKKGGKGKGGGFREQSMKIFVDQDSKKIAGSGKCWNDTCGFIVAFTANNSADIYQFKVGSKKCLHKTAPKAVFRKQCLPANATFQGAVNIGPTAGGLGVNVWRFHGGSHSSNAAKLQVFVSGRAVVTAASCLPVIFQDHGLFRSRKGGDISDGTEFQMEDDAEMMGEFDDETKPKPRPGGKGGVFMGSAFYNNVDQAIKDPSVFNPPAYCKKSDDLKFGEEMEYPDIIDRFVSLEE